MPSYRVEQNVTNGARDLQIQSWFQESIAGRQCGRSLPSRSLALSSQATSGYSANARRPLESSFMKRAPSTQICLTSTTSHGTPGPAFCYYAHSARRSFHFKCFLIRQSYLESQERASSVLGIAWKRLRELRGRGSVNFLVTWVPNSCIEREYSSQE